MYLFYIDESGNRDIGHIEQERFYVLTAVGMYEGRWKRFYFDIASPKNRIISRIAKAYGITLDFATDAEVKSTLLRNEKARQNHPFSLYQTEDERMGLVNEFYGQLEKNNVVLISVVIDKKCIVPASKLADQ